MFFIKSPFRPPMLRNHEETPERHATWLELFFDLAFVAVIGQVSAALAHSHNAWDLCWFGILIIPIWWAWVGQVYYLSRFEPDDMSHRLASFAQVIVLGFMGTTISKAFTGDFRGFVICYVVLRLILVLQYVYAGRFIPQARHLISRYAAGFAVAAGLWLVSIFVPAPWTILFWALGIFVDFKTPNMCREMNLKYPPHPMHTPERFGLFTIIVLGEAVIATVATLSGQEISGVGLVAAIMGLLLACAIWWVYFDGVGAAEVRVPHSTGDLIGYRVWLYSHLPLHAAIVLMAFGVERAVLHPALVSGSYEVYVLPCTVGVVMLMMHSFYNATVPKETRRRYRTYLLPHTVVTLTIVPVIAFASKMSSMAGLTLCFLLFGAHAVLNIRDYPEEMDVKVA